MDNEILKQILDVQNMILVKMGNLESELKSFKEEMRNELADIKAELAKQSQDIENIKDKLFEVAHRQGSVETRFEKVKAAFNA